MGPLEGVKVLSFGTGAVIPDFGKVMGELGADVIKIESRENPDFMRSMPGRFIVAGFAETNRNKRSFGVNLKTQEGKELITSLIKWADVLGENFRGDVLRNLGFDYENVRKINPGIIYISSQGYGSGGPYGDYQAYGPMLSAVSGMLSIWGHSDDPYPAGSAAPIPDHIASKQAVLAVVAALDYRRRTGKGQFIDMAQTEVAANLIGERFLEYTVNKRIPQRMGNRVSYAAPHGCYPSAGEDKWCAIAVFTDEEWQAFCNAIGRPAWTGEPRFADTMSRLENADELDRLVGEWTATREAREVMEVLQEAGVSAGVVAQPYDTIDDLQLHYDRALVELDHPALGRVLYPSPVFRLSGTPAVPSTRAPLLGEHTEEICRELLNMPDEEIGRLLDKQVLYSPANEPEEAA